MFENLSKTINKIATISISDERKEILKPLIEYIQIKFENKEEIRLNFICTHNSRRSHLCQVWAQTMAYYFRFKNVYSYSGGTEATALFPKVAQILEIQGYKIQKINDGDNPVYGIKFDENQLPIIGFSKTYFDDFNPKSDYAAIMACSQADNGCPFILGAEKRIAVTYNDPKEFDNSTLQHEKYLERSLQIASEMYYVFSKIKK